MPHCPLVDCAFAGTARRAAYVPNPGRRLKPHVQFDFAVLANESPARAGLPLLGRSGIDLS